MGGERSSGDRAFETGRLSQDFYKGFHKLYADGLTWQQLKIVLRNRHKDVRTDQYHYMKLQTARQANNEHPQAFADRFRQVAHKIVRWTIL